MRVDDAWNHRVLIVDDQEAIHKDFEEMLAPGTPARATDSLAGAFVPESGKAVLPRFELSHAESGDEACRLIRAAQDAGHPFPWPTSTSGCLPEPTASRPSAA